MTKPKTKKTGPKKMGRPTLYNEAVADEICRRMAEGDSLVDICLDPEMPARSTVLMWLHHGHHKDFLDKYARAREAQADYYAEKIVKVAEERRRDVPLPGAAGGAIPDTTAIQRDRLIVDALKWYASKLAPKKYGDKIQQELTGGDGAPLIPEISVTVKRDG